MDSVVFLIFTCFSVVGSEIHTLEYIYTALSKPVEVPGVYEFTAIGILDNEQIDYYNSKDKIKIPRQTWMSEGLDGNYWDKGTSSRKSKEQWFKVNVEILMTRMNHSRGGLHVLQWRHGCQGEPQPGGTLAFREGFDEYSYDGGDFLSFDPTHLQWVAPVPQARPTKHKWDHSQTLNQYTEGYLKRECMDWLNKFRGYGEKDLNNQPAPEVYPRAKTGKTPGKVTLHCLATGLHSRDVEVDIYRNHARMAEADGLTSTGIRPSEFSDDGSMAKTYQLKKSIEILKSDLDKYSYKVTYRGDVTAAGKWEPESDQGTMIAIVVTVVVLCTGVIAAVLLVLIYKKKGNCFPATVINRKSTPAGTKTEEQKLKNVSSDGSSTSSDTDMEKQQLRNGEPNGTCSTETEKLIQRNGSFTSVLSCFGSKYSVSSDGSSSHHSDSPLLNGVSSDGSSTSSDTDMEKQQLRNGDSDGTCIPEAEKLMQPNGDSDTTCSPEDAKQPNGDTPPDSTESSIQSLNKGESNGSPSLGSIDSGHFSSQTGDTPPDSTESSTQSLNKGGSNGNPSPCSSPLLNGDKSNGSSTSDSTESERLNQNNANEFLLHH